MQYFLIFRCSRSSSPTEAHTLAPRLISVYVGAIALNRPKNMKKGKTVYEELGLPFTARPWIQDFNMGAIYTPELVRAQMQAALGDDRAARADIATAIEMGQPDNWGGLVLPESSPDCELSFPDASTAVATK